MLPVYPRFRNLRREIWGGNDGRREIMDLKGILNTSRLVKKAARFMILMRILGQYGAVSTLSKAVQTFLVLYNLSFLQ